MVGYVADPAHEAAYLTAVAGRISSEGYAVEQGPRSVPNMKLQASQSRPWASSMAWRQLVTSLIAHCDADVASDAVLMQPVGGVFSEYGRWVSRRKIPRRILRQMKGTIFRLFRDSRGVVFAEMWPMNDGGEW